MSVQPFLLPAYLALCLVLGGASAAGVAANMLLQLLALPLLLIAALGNPDLRLQPPARQLLTLAALALGLALVQLVPLPPFLWTGLAGRDAIARGFEMLGVSLPWLPISLAPQQTLAAILWLLPALAVLVAVLRLENFRASWIAWTILAVTGLAVLFGALQSAGGMDSPWYFYEITNYGVAVGLFANANHMATMLVAAIPFLAALFVASRGGSRQRASAFSMMLAGALLVVFVGIGVNRSLAAIGLAVPVLAASGLMIWMRKRPLPLWGFAAVALLLAGSVAAAFSAPFGNNLTSEEARNSQDSRFTAFKTTLRATGDFLPLGSGIATFPDIYRRYEDPQAIDRFYMNHAHSDYLELALETGVPGMILILLFLLWWGGRTLAVWRTEEASPFARAASIASAAILAHSLVDYPLRTAAIGALFAACCGLMAETRDRTRVKERIRAGDARHLSADASVD